MKIARFSFDGGSKIGIIQDETIIDVTHAAPQANTMMNLIANFPAIRSTLEDYCASSAAPRLPLDQVKLLAPIDRPGKYLAIGMNYRKHVEEVAKLGIQNEAKQYWFNKQSSCINDPFGDILPGVSEMVDYEVELGVVIGSKAKNVSAADAHKFVFGYFVANDVTARDWQRHTPTFTIGKSFDTHGPIGPWIVTNDEIADPHNLELSCWVNGEKRQHGNTGQMIYNIWAQIEYLSTAFTLEPGDILATGTPEGVGAAMEPPTFLKAGDVVRCEVEGIGAIESRVSG